MAVRPDYRPDRPRRGPQRKPVPQAVRLTDADRHRLAEYVDLTCLPMSTIIRAAIDEYLGYAPSFLTASANRRMRYRTSIWVASIEGRVERECSSAAHWSRKQLSGYLQVGDSRTKWLFDGEIALGSTPIS